MHLIFLILTIFPLSYKQFKQWTFKMSLETYLPYITLNLGSKTQSLRTFIDISNHFSFVSSNVYHYNDSFTFSKKNNITMFKYNNKNLMGYLSNDSMIYYGDRYEFKNFYLIHSDTNYDKYSTNSKSVLCQSRNVSNTNFSLLYQLRKKQKINGNVLTMDYYFDKAVHFGKENIMWYTKKNIGHSCSIIDYKDDRWNCRILSFNIETKTNPKINITEKYNNTVYFDSNKYYNILPYSLLKKLMDTIFTYEILIYCDEMSDGELIRYVCHRKGIEMFKAKKARLNINFEDNFYFSISYDNLIDDKGNFIFTAKEFPDFDEYEFDIGNDVYIDFNWKEEVIFGYTIMRLLSLSFDADMNQIRFYNDKVIHSFLLPSKFVQIKNLLLIISLILVLSIIGLKIKSITLNSGIYKYNN